jgi:hypothetical protein
MNQALYYGDRLKHTLLNPNQLRSNGLKVEDVPRQFDKRSTHSIIIPNAKDGDQPLVIALELGGGSLASTPGARLKRKCDHYLMLS